MLKILLTSTSFHETPGSHHDLLNNSGHKIEVLKGPVNEEKLIPIIADYDAVICGDDDYTRRVLEIGKKGKLKYISKYGVGLDKVDLLAAKELGIVVVNCPNLNQQSVSEHVYALLLTFTRNIHFEFNFTRKGEWVRLTGSEIGGKTIGVIGMGAVGKEVLKKAKAFNMNAIGYDIEAYAEFAKVNKVKVASSLEELIRESDIISIHLPLNDFTENIINDHIVKNIMKKGVILINTSRGGLVEMDALLYGLENNIIKGYLADVLDIEPMPSNYKLKDYANVLITPHIGSRTIENVERQGRMAVNNLLKLIGDNA